MKYLKIIGAAVVALLILLFGGAAVLDYREKQNIIDNSVATYEECSVLPRTHADGPNMCSDEENYSGDGEGDTGEMAQITTKMPDKSKDGCLVDCEAASIKPKP